MEQAVVDTLNLKKKKKPLCIENKKGWKKGIIDVMIFLYI